MGKLIINIPEGTKEQIIALTNLGESFPPKLQERIVRAIINGTPLPKGHGDLIDVSELLTISDIRADGSEFTYVPYSAIDNAQIIIKTNKTENEE